MIKKIIIMSLFSIVVNAQTMPTVESNNSSEWTINEKKLPLPSCASKEIQKRLSNLKQPNVEARRNFSPKTKEEWKEWVEYTRVSGEYGVKNRAEKYGVSIKEETVDGVNVYTITPISLANKNTKHLFVYLHGGAYILVEACRR